MPACMRTIALAILALALTGSAAASPVVKTACNAKLKQTILVDARGHTLYTWTTDTGGQPVCVDDSTYHCDKHWIPLYTWAGGYGWHGDKKPGDIGQGYAGLWYVLTPAGKVINKKP